MNRTVVISTPKRVDAQPSGRHLILEGMLTKMGLTKGEANNVLAKNKQHASTLEALFIGASGKEPPMAHAPPPVGLKRRSSGPLPAKIVSLAQDIASVAPRKAVALLAVVLTCTADACLKHEITSACADVCRARPDMDLQSVLGSEAKAAFQKEVFHLLAQQGTATYLKRTWAPLLEYRSDEALARVASVPKPGNSSSRTLPASDSTALTTEPLVGLFYAALIKEDPVVMEAAIERLSELPGVEAKQSHTLCLAQFEALQAAKIAGPSTLQDLMHTLSVSQNMQELKEFNEKGPQEIAHAVTRGDVDTVRALLTAHGELLLNAKLPPSGWTALALAAALGEKDVVNFLLTHPFKNEMDVNALCPGTAASQKQAEALGYNGSVEKATPLFLAARQGHKDVVELLLKDQRVDVNMPNAKGTPPCHMALVYGHESAARAFLSRKDLEVNKTTQHEETLLNIAAQKGQVEMLELLLNDPLVDALKPDKNGQSPLHWAAADIQDPEAVGLLLGERSLEDKRKLANQTCKYGIKPLAVAARCGNNAARVIEPLRELTAVTTVQAAGEISTNYSQGLIVVGSNSAGFPVESLKKIAESGSIGLQKFGDGVQNMTWEAFKKLPVPEGAFAFVDCHGGWNVALQNHTLELGKQELVPTSEVIRVLYEKGVRKMTFVSCFILNGAEGITRLINSDPDWPKPLDRNMEITFVGSHSESLVGSNLYDLHNRMRDYVALKGKGEGGSMERLTVSSRSILTWDQEKGEVVMTHHGSPKDADRGDLTEEQRKTVQGNLLLKRTDHILLPDRVEPAAPIKPATTTTTTSTISTTTTTTTTTTTAATAAATATATATTSLADSTATTTTVSSSTPKPNTTETKRLQRLREMLARPETNVNYQDSQGFTALSLAVGLGSPEAVALLLQHPDVDVNLTNVNGDTPLHGAGYGKTGSRSQEVVELLVKGNGILINKKTQTGATPLYIAAQEGHTGMVEVLLRQKGIEINVPDSAGATPLYVAAQNGHLEVVRLLLANKAGLNCRYGDPIEAARSEQHTEIVKMLEEAKKQSAPALRYRDRGNMPSLLMAAQLGQVKTVTKLLNMEGVPVNRPDSKGVTPLHGAAESGQTEVVKLLLEVDGIEVNGRTPLGRTALYAAAAKGHINVVKLLLAKKADLTCDKEDPVDIARKNQHHDIVKLLEEAGSTGKAAKSPSDDCITM